MSSLENLRSSRIILPILIGLGVVGWLIFKEFDAESFEQIDWHWTTAVWILCAILLTFVRQFAYMWRIKTLTEHKLSWKKAFQTIAIWEFGSAVTPSMVGGTAVGLFVLTKEGVKASEASAIIFFTIFLDSFFFLTTTTLFWLFYGHILISPKLVEGMYTSIFDDAWMYAFVAAFCIMVGYTILIFYGLFINPTLAEWLLHKATSIGFLKRWNKSATQFGRDMRVASVEIRKKGWQYWFYGFASTYMAWSARFLVVLCLVLAFVSVGDYVLLYGRQLSLYLILFLTPTPGGSGVADFAFKDFYSDFIGNVGLATAIGALWRLLTYYPYLLLGVFVMPQWAKRVFRKSK